ncbi:hypothetical protein [Pararhizobium mangrovi]|uniref:Uncharacterized protein n=1 Tax=Pararhizobium mangrovi TaxID=2590452 RepID=A0A506TZC1_9HYPH|nr:hypothetical protein [Pararhizobium mangrovi]TPW27433.1 hypothetical protein FJU11_11750 [Pararhizobium mangrovi]
MSNADETQAELRRNFDLVRTPLGVDWSGRTRYAAAVYLYNCGEMDSDVLEIYRICSRLDGEDPLAILRTSGIGRDWLEKIESDD